MVKSIALSLVLVLATGSTLSDDRGQATMAQPTTPIFDSIASRDAVTGTMPAFWVAHEWDESPTFAERFNDKGTLANTLNKGFAVVPEPGTVTLLTLGVVALLLRKRISH